MNKTVTVNIGGMVFHIEEQAYDQLRKYLEAIKGYFTTSDGRDEIIQDIESRIAEMFIERIGSSRQVITPDDVNHVVNALGRPAQVAGADESQPDSAQQTNSGSQQSTHARKRLYRDPDDKVIGGVCSGIGHYIGIDPVWLRLAFALALIFYGTGVLLYLLLLIIIPKAKTTSEKLEMKGQPVNLDNIRRTIDEEVEEIKSRLSGKTIANTGKGTISGFFDAIGAILLAGLKFFVGFIAVIIAFVMIFILFSLFMVMLAMAGLLPGADLPLFLTENFLDAWQVNLLTTALTLLVGIPALVLLYRIVRALFKLPKSSKYFNYSAGTLWVFGLLLGIWMSIDAAAEFKEKNTQVVTIPIQQPSGDTLQLSLLNPSLQSDEDDEGIYIQNSWEVHDTNDTIRIGHVHLDVQRADGNAFELIRITESRGRSGKTAGLNARRIVYETEQVNNELRLADNYILPANVKFRNQKVKMIVKVPLGKSIFLDEKTKKIIYDIKNVTNTYDGDMAGHTWTMTERGLECLSCGFSTEAEKINDAADSDEVTIRINGKKMDMSDAKDSMNFQDKDLKIKISKDGVLIDTKDK